FGVEADVGCGKPVILGMLQIMIDLRRAQQRLGRDATPVEADAAQIVALDDRRLEAELRRPDRRHIAAWPGTDDDDVETGVSHVVLLSRLSRFQPSHLHAPVPLAPPTTSRSRPNFA